MMKKIQFYIYSFIFLWVSIISSSQAQNVNWIQMGSSTSDNATQSIAIDASGNTYTSGYFQNTITFGGTTLTSAGGIEGYLVKHNPTGMLVWARRIGGTSNDYVSGIVVSGSSIYITGTVFGTANFNTPSNFGTNTINPLNGFYLALFDTDGNFQWAKTTLGGTADRVTPNSITFVNSNIYIGGTFGNFGTPNTTAIFDGNTITVAGTTTDNFLVKADASGNFQWAKRIGMLNTGDDGLKVTVSSATNDIYIATLFTGTIDFNTPYSGSVNTLLASGGGYDITLAKFDASGNFQWAKRAGGSSANISGSSIAIDGTNIYLSASYNGDIDFNTPSNSGINVLSTGGGLDMFLTKYDTNGNIQWIRKAGGTTGFIGVVNIKASNNRVFLTGNFDGTPNFNTPSAAGSNEISMSGGADIYLASYDNLGNFLWASRAGGAGFEQGYDMVSDGSSVYLAGVVAAGVADFNTPSDAGSNTITGTNASNSFIAKYNDCVRITTTLPNGIANSPYNQTLTQVGLGGTPIWSVVNGTLPTGLTLNPTTGVISGTSTTGGLFSFTIRVSDGACFNNKLLSLRITGGSNIPNALNFTGTTYVNCGNVANMDFINDFTVEAWIKPSTFGSRQRIFSKGNGGTGGWGFGLNGGNDQLIFTTYNVQDYVTTTVPVVLNTWQHIAMVMQADNSVEFYVNGVLQETITGFSGANPFNNVALLGSAFGGGEAFEGEMDEVRIWSTARCAFDINTTKNCELVGNEPNLVAYYNFNQGVAGGNNAGATGLIDLAGEDNNGTLTGFALTGAISNWVTSSATVSGTCSLTPPVISVTGNGNAITTGSSSVPSLTNHTDFGNVGTGSNLARTYTIRNNSGGANLVISGANVTGANATDFVISGLPATPFTITPGNTQTFTITFASTAPDGLKNARINLTHDDCIIGRTYKFNIQANSTLSSITTWDGTVWSNGTPTAFTDAIINGDYSTAINGNISAKTITINTGFTLTVGIGGSVTATNDFTNNGVVNNCASGAVTFGSFVGTPILTQPAEPTTEASGLSFSAVTGNGFVVNWTSGNGTKRVVVVKPTTAASPTALTDGAVYTANPDIGGAGSTVDGTGKVTYIGIGNSAIIRGLSETTTYHVAIFEYNEGTCGANYKTGSPLSGSQATNTLKGNDLLLSRAGNANAGNASTLRIEGNITIEAWINPGNPAIGSEAINTIIGNKGNGIATPGFAFFINSYSFTANDNRLHFETQGKTFYTLPNAVTPGVWQHIAVSVDGATQSVNFYVNGVLKTNDGVNPDAGVNLTETALNLRIGSFGNGSFPFIGEMDELRVWNRALSQVEITTNINKTLSGDDCNLLAYWKFDEGLGATVSDATAAGNTATLSGTYGWAISGANITSNLPPPVTPCVTTWSGTAWSAGKPTSSMNVVMAGNYDTGVNGLIINAKNIIVNVGSKLTIGATGQVKVFGDLTANGEVANCAGGTLTVTGISSGNIAAIAPTEPTTEASAINFTTVSGTGFTINWTSGNGNKRIIVVKPTTAISPTALTDNTIYVANANFGSVVSSVVDGTAKVVYNGIGNSVTVTGLNPSTVYEVAIFEFNDNACGKNYKTGSPASNNQTTPGATTWNGTTWSMGAPNATTDAVIDGNYDTSVNGNITAQSLNINASFSLLVGAGGSVNVTNALTNNGVINNCAVGTVNVGSFSGTSIETTPIEPTIEANSITFTNINTTNLTINWTNGNGAKRIVVIKPTTTVSTTALADNTVYTADTNFSGGGSVVDGTGKVAFNGTGSTVTITNINPNTTYQIAIFEYNESLCGQNYKIGSPANGSQITANSTTWNGFTWSAGVPVAGVDATINGNYSTATNGNITANNLTVNNTYTLTVHAVGNLTITNVITNNGTINNCANGTITSGSLVGNVILIPATEPTTEATGVTISTILTTQFTINWTNGDGAKRIVVVKPATAVSTTALADGLTYTADANFAGAGSIVDGTGKVVYNGNTSTSVTVAGLNSNQLYYVAIFEYNETLCNTNYKIGSPANTNATTLLLTTWNGVAWSAGIPNNTTQAVINGNYNTATDGSLNANILNINVGFTLTLHNAGSVIVSNALTNNGTINNCATGTIANGSLVGNAVQVLTNEPTTAANAVNFTGITTTGFTVNWTNGNGTNRIVVVKSNTIINGTALVDRTTYTANANFSGGGSVVDGTGKVVYDGTGNSVTVTGLLPNATYYVAVFEYNTSVPCGANYKTDVFATGVQVNLPTAPIALTATKITPFSFITNWLPVTGANSYLLEISKFSNFSSIDFIYPTNGTSYELIDLMSGIAYYYRVRAVNAAGQSANSNVIGVSLPQLLAPIAVAATGVKSTEFLAKWQLAPNGGASYFQIDVAEDANFTRMVANYSNLVVRGEITALVKDLKPFTTYYYRVRAVAGISVANISQNSNVISVTTLPTPPKAIEAPNITSNSFQARWEALQGITSFRLDVSSNKDFTTLLVNNTTVSGTSFTVTNLPIATAYFYRLRAVTSNPILTSENSNVIEVKPTPVAPVSTTATNVKDNAFTANWREVVGADAYLLDVSEQANFATALTGFKDLELKGISKEITGLKEGKIYYYRLRAFNSSGNSLYSNTIEVITLPSIPQNLNLISTTLQQINFSWTASKSELPLTYLVDVATNSGFTNTIVKDRTTTLTNLSITATFEAGKEYYLRVKARHNRNGESEYSETLVIKMIPPTPLSLVISKVTENSFNLAWGNALGADSYEVEIATIANFTPILRSLTATATNIDVSGLNSLQQYFVRVRAVNKTGKSGNSFAANTITLPNPTTTNKAKNVGSQQFTASWNVSTQVNIYILEVARNEGFTDMLAGFSGLEISNILERFVSWQGRENELYYRVKVVGTVQGQRLVSRPSNIQKVRILQAPFGFKFSNIKQTSFDVDWNAVEGAEQYEVSVSLDNFATILTAYNQVKVSSPSIKLEKLEGNRPYQIRVKALSSDGASDNGTTSQLTLPPFPEEVFIRRLSTTRTTEIQWQYFSLPFNRVSNMRFVVERSDTDNAPFRPISSALTLADSRSLRYDDVTGTQRLQATYRLKISNEAGEVIFNIPNRIVTAVDNGLIDENLIVLYPNPSSDVFRLQIQKMALKPAQIRIFDNAGRLVKIWEEIKSVNESEFDISGLAVGKYIVEISWEKQSMRLHLVKD